MGFTNRMGFYPNVTNALIPCDYVVNAMMVGTAIGAQKKGLTLYHICPSHTHQKFRLMDTFVELQNYLKF